MYSSTVESSNFPFTIKLWSSTTAGRSQRNDYDDIAITCGLPHAVRIPDKPRGTESTKPDEVSWQATSESDLQRPTLKRDSTTAVVNTTGTNPSDNQRSGMCRACRSN